MQTCFKTTYQIEILLTVSFINYIYLFIYLFKHKHVFYMP